MRVLVTRDFPCWLDGKTKTQFCEGDEPDNIPEDLIPGLERAGYIVVDLPPPDSMRVIASLDSSEYAAAADIVASVNSEIAEVGAEAAEVPEDLPADWRTMRVGDLRALATKQAGREVTKVEEAREILEAVEARQKATRSGPAK